MGKKVLIKHRWFFSDVSIVVSIDVVLKKYNNRLILFFLSNRYEIDSTRPRKNMVNESAV